MSLHKLPSGKWRGRLKVGRENVSSRSFNTKREAAEWVARERAALKGGIDPRAGRVLMRKAVELWLEERKAMVAPKTYTSDKAVPRLTPTFLSALQIGAITDREISRVLVVLTRQGLAETSVKRYRSSLSAFFAWTVRERLLPNNPVTVTRVPKASEVMTEMQPFTEEELELFVKNAAQLAARDGAAGPVRAAVRADDLARLADLLLVAGWTGLRWSELREVRVGDFAEVPMPAIMVRRAAPEGHAPKRTKSGKSRLVPVADRVLPIVRALAAGRAGGELLFVTASGHRLHASAVKRATDWRLIAGGRRIHDLRHTAACLWLARGVDVVTVQAWMGHASVATTNIYLHHLGTTADRAGLDRLNGRGATGGPPGEAAQK